MIKTYLVGGAVRDILLGLVPKDQDYVVVGSTPEEMLSLGFKQVGADFPVFLHPTTGEEYALARKERKTAPGYNGFETEFGADVSLEEDLSRRDLTINSMAMSDDGGIIDPYGGEQDLKDKILRHTSGAFVEDPVRILRTARFAARYEFQVADETITFMAEMVNAGEFDALTPERVWVEFEKAFRSPNFHIMRNVLIKCSAWRNLQTYRYLDIDAYRRAESSDAPYVEKVASAFVDVSRVEYENARVPKEISDLATVADHVCNFIEQCHSSITKESVLSLFAKTDLYRKPERFYSAVRVAKYRNYVVPNNVLKWSEQVLSVDCGAVAATCINKTEIPGKIMLARLNKML